MNPFGENSDIFSVFDDKPTKDSSKNKRKSKQEVAPSSAATSSEYGNDDFVKKLRSDVDREIETKRKKAKQQKTTNNASKEGKVTLDVEDAKQLTSDSDNVNDIHNTKGVFSADVETMVSTSLEKEVISCLHELCLPPLPEGEQYPADFLIEPTYPTQPARTYKFELDPFQKKSVSCLEAGHSVLVSAHTSAGKTVVAEYAIAMSLKAKQRVIYTSPIKALSNQKYRELYETFGDVGLMTGDTTISPNASCLVMTTEILRSMLYRGSEIMREVAWVIFDEIHYMRDKERGVVWEETIILLPDMVKYVFLSATIPNAKEFALWVAKTHKQPCHVVYTDMRPTPLQHYIFPSGGDGLHLVVDEKGTFREDNFQKALAALAPKTETAHRNNQKGKKGGKGGPSDIFKIVKMIMERNYQPVIVFAFSKKECEALALQMSKLDLSDEDEKKLIEKIFQNAIDSLSEDDKTLPQVINILPLLKRGVGIHHSGLLPILKEVIEILFQEGLLKALFATETFSMGLNMPAKTVVFTNVRKFDGENFRWVSGGEYIQMSGRAGRRGLDDRGIVIMMVDEKMEPSVAKGMVKGSADPLNSSFYIGYNMLLNLLRVEEIDPEYMLRKSFHQFQTDRAVPGLEKKAKETERARDLIEIPEEDAVAEYYQLKEQMSKLKQDIQRTITQPIHALPFLQPGRLVKVRDGEEDWGWGVVVNFQKKTDKQTSSQSLAAENLNAKYIVDVLLSCSPDSVALANTNSSFKLKPSAPGENGAIQVVPILLPLIENFSSIRVIIPKDLRPQESRQSVGKSIKEVIKRMPDGIPLLDPIEDMKIEDADFMKIIRKVEVLEDRLTSSKVSKAKDIKERYELYRKKMELDSEVKALKKQLKQSDNVILKTELKGMKRVLRRLGYTNSDDIIETKGRVACEINAADELVITEMIFAGIFNELTVEQVVAVLSCFTFQEKVDANTKLKEELAGPYRQVQEAARKVAKVEQESKLTVDVDEYVQKFSPHMMEVCYAWANGAKFSEICGLTDIFEGSIIRAMRRLEELLRQLASAAKSIGNTELESKFAEGINKIKRDIVFAASLYL